MRALAPRQRWLILGGGLIVTLALVLWPDKEPEEPPPRQAESVAPVEPPASSAGKAPVQPGQGSNAGAALKPARGDKGAEKPEIRELFGKQSWYVPPPATAPAAPEVPPLPFTYFGRLIQDGQVTVYLTDDTDRNLAVRQGDVIGGAYRVKRISPKAITFVYIPTNKQQTLDIGRSN